MYLGFQSRPLNVVPEDRQRGICTSLPLSSALCCSESQKQSITVFQLDVQLSIAVTSFINPSLFYSKLNPSLYGKNFCCAADKTSREEGPYCSSVKQVKKSLANWQQALPDLATLRVSKSIQLLISPKIYVHKR